MIKMRITHVLLVFCLVILSDASAFARCRVPSFREGQDYGASVFVSISPRDFTVDKLVCLAQSLRDKRSSKSKRLYVAFFGSDEAAKYFQPPGAPHYSPQFAQQLHATYTFDSAKQQEDLDIVPLGLENDDSMDTTINLALRAPLRCRLQMRDRCLMAVAQQIAYPEDALKQKVSGAVSLTATINADGTIANVLVTEADVHPIEGKDMLAGAALKNLETWQFDASTSRDPIRIVYSYIIDVSLQPGSPTEVRLELPNQVVIRANPSKPN